MGANPQLQHNIVLDGVWSRDHAARLYGLEGWGNGYFGINAGGHLTVRPKARQRRGR